MTKEEAIQIIDQVTAQIPLTRKQHEQILQAIKTLSVLEDKKVK